MTKKTFLISFQIIIIILLILLLFKRYDLKIKGTQSLTIKC